MNYIVMDLEWNQSNTGREPEVKRIPFEIIEIGAVKLNSDFVMVSRFSRLVKPQVYREMHHITGRLIHMRMEELAEGKSFAEVMTDFREWCGDEEYMFCTWGPLDLTELQRNIRFFGMEPLAQKPLPFFDVQKLFSIAYEDRRTRRSLEWAVDYLQLEKDIPFHRAFSDAYYAAKVMTALKDKDVFANVSYDVFYPPRSRQEEVRVRFDTYAKYISRIFPDKTAALADREVSSSKCYLCRRNLRKKIKWFSPNGKNYYCTAFCEKHGWFKYKVRIRKAEDEGVYVVKTSRPVAQEEADKILKKYEHTRELHKRHRQSYR